MAKKLCREEYTIRTLSYYQCEGGVYNDVITYLTNLRRESKHRGMQPVHELLNKACYALDYSRTLPEDAAAAYIAEQPAIIRDIITRLQDGQKQKQAAMTLQAIIDYILAHKQYQFVNQIINMLKDLVGRTCTEEEYRQILDVEMKMMENSCVEIHNHNDIHDSNVFPGIVNNPQFPKM